MDYFALVAQAYGSLTATERRLADYLCAHAALAERMNIRELAQAAGVSASTVVRFVRAIGFERYAQMIVSLARADAAGVVAPRAGADDAKETIGEYGERLAQSLTTAIHQTVALMQESEDFRRAVSLIGQADMVYLYGVGSSGSVAQELMQKLMILGKPCFFQSDSFLSRTGTRNITPRDVAVGISYSGRNQLVWTAMEHARAQGAPTVCITRVGSRLARLADACLRVPPWRNWAERAKTSPGTPSPSWWICSFTRCPSAPCKARAGRPRAKKGPGGAEAACGLRKTAGFVRHPAFFARRLPLFSAPPLTKAGRCDMLIGL